MQFPEFDPVLFSIGPLDIRWYALAYVAGAGDCNRDGVPDFLIGAAREGSGGAARLYSGVDGAELRLYYGPLAFAQFEDLNRYTSWVMIRRHLRLEPEVPWAERE